MKLEYTVVHSEDKWLLARLTTDLQMCGLECYEYIDYDPFMEKFNWVSIYRDNVFSFYNHSCLYNPIRYELTESNYTEVLTKILGE